MTQILSAIPDDLKHRSFLGFSARTDPQQAADAYLARHGAAPLYVIAVPNNLLVGPLPLPAPRQMTLAEAVQ
jgi:hypothetical protein